jgi:hypothetical protein
VECAGRPLGAELFLNQMEDVFEVANEGPPIVMIEPMRRVLSVIAKIEKDQLVMLAQWLPERQITIDRKAVAMTQHESRAARISMLAHADGRAIFHHGVDRSQRRWHLDTQSHSFPSVAQRNSDCADAIDNPRRAQN